MQRGDSAKHLSGSRGMRQGDGKEAREEASRVGSWSRVPVEGSGSLCRTRASLGVKGMLALYLEFSLAIT